MKKKVLSLSLVMVLCASMTANASTPQPGYYDPTCNTCGAKPAGKTNKGTCDSPYYPNCSETAWDYICGSNSNHDVVRLCDEGHYSR